MKRLIKIYAAAIAAALCCAGDACAQKYEAYIDSADNYVSRERYAEAAACYRNALREKPGSPLNSKIFANLGICLTETGDIPGALEAFDVALVREPSSAAILNSRARAYVIANRRQDALADLDAALKADSLHAPSLRLRGQLLMLDRRYTDASADFATLRRRYPDNSLGSAGMAECLAATGDYDQAIDLYKEAIETEDEPVYNVGLATALINSNRLTEAADVLREAIRRHPRTGELYMMRGVLHLRMFRNDDALTDKKTAISLGVDPAIVDSLIPGRP